MGAASSRQMPSSNFAGMGGASNMGMGGMGAASNFGGMQMPGMGGFGGMGASM